MILSSIKLATIVTAIIRFNDWDELSLSEGQSTDAWSSSYPTNFLIFFEQWLSVNYLSVSNKKILVCSIIVTVNNTPFIGQWLLIDNNNNNNSSYN